MEIAVTTNPTAASAIATRVPPGTRITSGPAGSRCSTIIAANMNRNGMKYAMIPILTSASYAPRTDVPAWPRKTNTPAIAACTSSATYGVRHVGCSLPNAGGRNRSRPATNGSRAVAANQPPTPPSALSVTSAATPGAIHCIPTLAVIACTACMMPCSPDTCSLGIASRTLSVPAM